jgi:long-chain acyl-CoA synthetase
MTIQTINDLLFAVVKRDHERVMMHKREDRWVAISSREIQRYVTSLAHALADWGIAKGDRVAILSENRPEWAFADFATLLVGAVAVPIYPTLTAEQAAYILNDSGARVAFVSTAEQFRKVDSIRHRTRLERIVVMDNVASGTGAAISMRSLFSDRQAEQELEKRARSVRPEDLATVIYTSGTTGTPKGVMLTHSNLVSNLHHSLKLFELSNDDVSLSFLPLSHITARHVDYAMMMRGVSLAYCGQIELVQQAIREVRPTFFVAVPRFYEKIYNQVQASVRSGIKRRIYEWAIGVGRRQMPNILAGRIPRSLAWKLANKLLFSKVRQGLGGRVRYFVSGGAPLGKELATWYASIGIRIHEGYGLTETSPVIAVNNPGAHKLGTVGKPLDNVEVRIAADGEILVRGPSIFRGYWNQPEESRDAFVDGWFKTGDIGHVDSEGYLSVTDRKKDLVKTSGGKFIAPQPIETALKANVLIAEACVVGDRRKFPAVIIAPNFPLLEEWAKNNGVTFSSRQELVRNPRVSAMYEGIVEDLNSRLAQFERLKKVIIIADEFTISSGILTPTMKVRRREVEQRYREQIEALYGEPAPEALVER